jgi:hypothetical protein
MRERRGPKVGRQQQMMAAPSWTDDHNNIPALSIGISGFLGSHIIVTLTILAMQTKAPRRKIEETLSFLAVDSFNWSMAVMGMHKTMTSRKKLLSSYPKRKRWLSKHFGPFSSSVQKA